MLLKRRSPPSWLEWLRVWAWPRRSWMRSGQYVTKRILRLTASPHAVASGVAMGVFTSCSPFLGLHFLISFALATLVRGNLIAAALGTFFGNPITFPFIWATAYELGNRILGNDVHAAAGKQLGRAMRDIGSVFWTFDFSHLASALGEIWTPLLYPMMIGGIILGTIVALPVYVITRRAALIFREARRDKLMAKAAEIREHAKATAVEKASSLTDPA
jgi:uncharacterized protein (DUF2062 family)